MTARRRLAFGAAALAVLGMLVGCTSSGKGDGDSDSGLKDGPKVLRVLAGSEVKDMVPMLQRAEKAVGVTVELEYVGSIQGTEEVASGDAKGHYDAIWFANNRYLSLLPGADSAITQSVKIMSSPVVFGLKPQVAQRLGWTAAAPSWSDIANAAAAGEFSYGMTNPAASNSGFSALVSVATALSGTGSALTTADIDKVVPKLQKFASAQKLTAGSSGWLADTYRSDPSRVDGLVNYESVLLGLKAAGQPLDIIAPSDGVVSNDYPLTLLSSATDAKRALFDKLTTWLTQPAQQRAIVKEVHRRPAIPGIDTGTTFPSGVQFETPFPNTIDVANGLISTYLDQVRAPSQEVFALDVSGSMASDGRIGALRKALKNLAGADKSTIGAFTSFRSGEDVTLIPFSDKPRQPIHVPVPTDDPQSAYDKITRVADGLETGGGTAIYDTLEEAYDQAMDEHTARPNTFVSVVMMTDGENNDGDEYGDFQRFYRHLGAAAKSIPCFVVLFGDSNTDEMTKLAKLTGGQTFDARGGDLAQAFQDIRGYQ
ncbi:MAG TPA: VWA domain-containing protein [Gryllotalpicola sp.]